jgi:16S rRNA (cytosine1402-N4)-methyltransferase
MLLEKVGHRSVLLLEAVESLAIQKDDVVVDATLGGAGHAKEMTSRLGENGVFIGFDADEDAIGRAKIALKDSKAPMHLIHANFRHMRAELEKIGVTRVDKVLFDLGWSGFQLTAGRGFSFLSDEPLSMAYDKDQSLSAYIVVNEWQEESLADVIFGWGEERYSRRIASAIVAARERSPIRTAKELADIIKAAVPASARYGRMHPATKTFQALRIAVNDELGALEESLRNTWQILEEGGRMAVISFHSLEDRIVKQRFVSLEEKGEGTRVTRKPIVPSAEELSDNPRARSAKLRIIEKNHHG